MESDLATSTATVLFCDVVGSTDRRTELGEVEADRFFRRVEQSLRATVAEHGGRTLKGAGDGIMAVFKASSDAVSSAAALQAVLSRNVPGVLLRVGVAAGDVSWEDDDCFGLPVVVAARLEGVCPPGSVLVSAIVRYLAGDRADVRYEAAGPFELKGIPDPVEAFTVVNEASPEERTPLRFPSVLPSVGRFPLVGRSSEQAWLEEQWQRVRMGGRGVALIGGEAGAGKTRLVTEFALRLHEEGVTVLAGACDSELSLPFQPWAKALGDLIDQLPSDALERHQDLLAGLWSLVPSVERLGVAAPDNLDPEAARHRMFLSVAAFLRRLTADGPVLLVLDDVHWAGQQTLTLLRFVARTEPVAGLLVAATFRDTGDEIGDPLAAVLAEFRRDDSADRIKLEGIDSGAIRELLLAAGLDADVEAQVAELTHRTGGNPFLVGELARQISAGDRLDAVPESVRDVVAGRLHQLSVDARSVVDLVAVGERVSFPELRVATGLGVGALGQALVEVVRSGLLIELAEVAPTYQFAHALMREAVDAGLPHVSRAGLHHSLAVALEQVNAPDPRPVLAQLARHFAVAAPLAGWEKAAHYGRRAAVQARQSAAYREAVDVMERTCEVVPLGTRELAQLLVDGADLLQRDGRHPSAIDWADRGLEAARTAGDMGLQVEAAIALERALHMKNSPSPRSVALLAGLLEEVDESDVVSTARVLASLGRAQWLVGERAGLPATRRALDMTRGLDEETRSHALERALVVETDPNQLLIYADELRDITTRTGDVFTSMWARNRRVHALLALGRLAEARSHIDDQMRIAVDYRLASYEYLSHTLAATLAMIMADFELAEREAEEANIAEHERFEGMEASGVYGLQMFMIRREQGRLAEIRPVLELLARDGAGAWRPGLLAAYAELGMLDEAAGLFDALAPDDFVAVARDSTWPLTLSFLVEAAVLLDRSDVAPVLLGELEPYAGLALVVGYSTCAGPADRWRALVAEWVGDHDLSDRALAAAASLAEASGSPVWQAQVAVTSAWIALRRGDAESALRHRNGAAALAERHGLGRIAGQLAALDERRFPGDATHTHPDGLSEREVEVLRLLGQGLTNRAIGEQLFISANTVANHVRNILQKTGTANRTEAVTHGMRHGLIDQG